MIGKVFFVHADNWWISTGNTEGSLEVASWLANEAQYSHKMVKWFEDQIINYDFETKKTNFIGSGNAHHIFSTGDHIFLMCEYVDEQKVLLTKEACLKALENYRSFLNSDYKNLEVTPEPFKIEYIAEGEEALAKFTELGGVLKA